MENKINTLNVTPYERKQLDTLRTGDRKDYFLRRDTVTGAVTVVSWWTQPDGGQGERRITCVTMQQVKNEVSRILENKQALINIAEAK